MPHPSLSQHSWDAPLNPLSLNTPGMHPSTLSLSTLLGCTPHPSISTLLRCTPQPSLSQHSWDAPFNPLSLNTPGMHRKLQLAKISFQLLNPTDQMRKTSFSDNRLYIMTQLIQSYTVCGHVDCAKQLLWSTPFQL